MKLYEKQQENNQTRCETIGCTRSKKNACTIHCSAIIKVQKKSLEQSRSTRQNDDIKHFNNRGALLDDLSGVAHAVSDQGTRLKTLR